MRPRLLMALYSSALLLGPACQKEQTWPVEQGAKERATDSPDAQINDRARVPGGNGGTVASSSPTTGPAPPPRRPNRPEELWDPLSGEWEPWLPDDCPNVFVSKNPETSVPPLRWEPCAGGVPGCQELAVTWKHTYEPFRFAQVSEVNGKAVMALHVPDDKWWWQFWATEALTPVASWLIDVAWEGNDLCGSVSAGGCDSHYCIGFGRSLAQKESLGLVALLDTETPHRTVLQRVPIHAFGDFTCTQSLVLGTLGLAGKTAYDIAKRQGREIRFDNNDRGSHSQGSPFAPAPFQDYVLVRREHSTERGSWLDGWSWTYDGGPRPLIQNDDRALFDLQTDGHSLVWTLAPRHLLGEPETVEVWVSPFTLNPAEVQPRKLGEVPTVIAGRGIGLVRNGYYAVLEGTPSIPRNPANVHLFRLSDGRHWVLPKPEDTNAGIALHISPEEVWYIGLRNGAYATVIRQRIENL